MADPIRLGVLEKLLVEDCYVGELQLALDVEQSLLSHHLRILRDEGLVESVREGKKVRYRLSASVGGNGRLDLGCCELDFDSSRKGAGSPGEGDPAVQA